MVGDRVFVHCTGWPLDDTKFDSSPDRKDRVSFDLGNGEVIKAWDFALATMKVGKVCRITCKPEHAYGSAASPPEIPPNATLVSEVELFGYQKDQVFDQRELRFDVGEGEDLDLPCGLEKAIQRMEKGEHFTVYLMPSYAFGSAGNEKFQIPPNAEVKYKAYLAVNDFDLARADFQKVLQLYPGNKAAKAQLVICQQWIRKQLAREKKLYANLFERLAEEEGKARAAAASETALTQR
ncbi:hypothetical protein MC885_001421 [Smutsia gigantea]|nr:hypothetical protein MC885_001421 [Smutsia gigantea]